MIFALLPAYNEQEGLPALLEAYADLNARMPEPLSVVLVDDGSTDATVQVARDFDSPFPLEIIEHDANRGLGAAFLTGFRSIVRSAQPADAIVTMDADNTHSPEYILQMLGKFKNADIVIASRYAPGGKEIGVPAFRRFLSHGASMLYSLFFGLSGVRDYTCGYRMYRAGLIQKALDKYKDQFIAEQGFSSTGEILLKLAPMAQRIDEVAFRLRYDLKKGQSKMPKIKTVIRTLELLFRLRKISKQARKLS